MSRNFVNTAPAYALVLMFYAAAVFTCAYALVKNQPYEVMRSLLNRNTSGRLKKREMLWEHEPTVECSHSFFEFSQTSTRVSIARWERGTQFFSFLIRTEIAEENTRAYWVKIFFLFNN